MGLLLSLEYALCFVRLVITLQNLLDIVTVVTASSQALFKGAISVCFEPQGLHSLDLVTYWKAASRTISICVCCLVSSSSPLDQPLSEAPASLFDLPMMRFGFWASVATCRCWLKRPVQRTNAKTLTP
ncbi:hypothetical protein BD289DRAFT_272546 [Coniella lustricola]|uniref:Secreted protein n=1 Tax=Coniella lustricola TaxID=2025994 RepID=A0A2T3AKQ0_9PEZI|nr:hypothetical protein BD289DRAFT_272546 [Coniella lustricola]